MKRFETTMTQRGRVTLPAEVCRVLGVKPQDKVTFQIDGDEVRIVRSHFTIEGVRGSIPALKEAKSLDEIYREAGEEYAQRVADAISDDQR